MNKTSNSAIRAQKAIETIKDMTKLNKNSHVPKLVELCQDESAQFMAKILKKAFNEAEETQQYSYYIDIGVRMFVNKIINKISSKERKNYEKKLESETKELKEKIKELETEIEELKSNRSSYLNEETDLAKVSLSSVYNVDQEISAMEEENRRVIELSKKFEKAFELEDCFLKEAENLSDTSDEVANLMKENEQLKTENDSIRRAGMSEERNKYILSGLTKFIQDLFKGRDNLELDLNDGFSITKDAKTKELMKKAIKNSLSFGSRNQAPIFEVSVGNQKAINKLMTVLSKNENTPEFIVVALISTVNSRLIELLSNSQKVLSSLKEYFPDVENKNLPTEIVNFIKGIQSSVEVAQKINSRVLHIDSDISDPVDTLTKFTNASKIIYTNIETELRQFTPQDTEFKDIPFAIKQIIQTNIKNAEDAKKEVEKTKDNNFNNESKILNSKIEQIEEKNTNLTIFNNDLEKTVAVLREKLDSFQIKLNLEINSNKILSTTLQKKSEQFEKRTKELLAIESEHHDAEIKRSEKIFNKQKELFEAKITRLTNKLETVKQRNKELEEICNTSSMTSMMQTLDSSIISSQQSTSTQTIQQIGEILNQCFTISGSWSEQKITKAVQALVVRVHLLEKEKRAQNAID